ncbi:flagella synthesis protein FlgN [Ferrovum myxofaciens]|jgi:flagella synthesis protein FlgN|uniref:flagella synthesis protein FlgN n=1 Tax=Ferrovum myxofaciens TaxID=416213 RepID=UPI0004E0D03F|nr:flagellar protein FlgN [Ferrovum myxofaciens]NDU88485.1 flagellar protein FlgN [Ferrovum sp.]
MSSSSISVWEAALDEEISALTQFQVLLDEEQGLLMSGETLPLIPLAEKKSRLAQRLIDLTTYRRELGNPPVGHSSDRLNDLLTKTQKAETTNRTNGELIQIRLRHNQQALKILQQAAQKATLYGPDGQTLAPTPGSGRPLASG